MSRGPRRDLLLVDKAVESSLLALEIYNKPRADFRVGSYIVLMSIAWTSLLHAIFEKEKVSYYYRQPNSRFYVRTEDGEKKAWDLSESARYYFDGGTDDADIHENLKFVIRMRNKIEHRFMPALEFEVQGECQALLLNFVEVLRREFRSRSLEVGGFSVPLQIVEGNRLLPRSKDEQKMIDFVKTYRNQLNSDVSDSQRYAYKVFVMCQPLLFLNTLSLLKSA